MQQDTARGENQKPAPQMKMNLTKEEMQTLQTCSRESFYYRCVPLGVLFMGSTSILVNRGFIRGHPRLGAIPKNMFAGLVAYIIGKVSYQGECRKRIMALENSPLAEAMRKGKRGRELITDMSTLPALAGNYATEETPSEPEAPKLLESYEESNSQGQGLDDSKRPTLDSFYSPSKDRDSNQQKFASYDDLRQQNRMEYERQQNTPKSSRGRDEQYPRPPPPPPSSTLPSSRGSASSGTERQRPARTNQYGDVIED